MAAPDPDLDRFDAVAARMPDLARAVDAFADVKLRERAYFELIGILNPTEDGDTLPADVVRQLANETREEARDGEELGEVILRLLDEHRVSRERSWLAQAALVSTGHFTEDQVDFDIAPRITELGTAMARDREELERHRQREADRVAQERWVAPTSVMFDPNGPNGAPKNPDRTGA